MIKPIIRFASLAILGICIVGGSPMTAFGQEDISQKMIPSLQLDQADVREALRALFKNITVSYSIAPEVQGSVTANMRDVSFQTALQNVLRQVDATYRVEGGVYEIIKRAESVGPNISTGPTPTNVSTKVLRRIKIRSADPQFIAMMIGAKIGSQNYSVAPEISTIAKTPSGSLGGGSSGGGSTGGTGGFGSGSLGSGSSGSSSGSGTRGGG